MDQQGANDDTPAPGTTHIQTPIYTVPPVITAIAYSPDGAILAVTGYHEILLHQSDGSELLARLIGESPRLESLAFSVRWQAARRLRRLAAEFGQVQVWDVAERRASKTFNVGTDELYGISFAPDGNRSPSAAPTKSSTASIWPAERRCWTSRPTPTGCLQRSSPTTASSLVSTGRDRAMKLIDLETSRFVDDINNPARSLSVPGDSSEGRADLYGGDLGFARLYEISDNQKRTAGRNDTNLLRTFDRQPAPVTAVAFSPDEHHVAIGSLGVVNIYSVDEADKSVLSLSAGMQGPIYSIAYRPDGSQIAVAGYDGQVRFFDPKSGALMKQFVPVPLVH